MFSLIAAVGKNREIGKNNSLIFHIKEDMEFFRNITLGHKVVMGRKTWESLPKKLKGRENFVISHRNFSGPDLIINDIKDFIKKNRSTPEEIFIIGGGQIYTEFLPYAKNLYLTEVDALEPTATTFFPDYNQKVYSRQIIKQNTSDNLSYSIVKYTKNN